MSFWQRVLFCLFILLALGCGGGAGNGSPFIGGAPGMNQPKHYGFFGECITDLVTPAKPHPMMSDLHYATGWCGPSGDWASDVIGEAQAASRLGYKVLVLAMPRMMIENRLLAGQALDSLAAAHLETLFDEVYVQWEDEPTTGVPERGPYSEAFIRDASAFVRTHSPYKLLGVYSCADSYAGLDTFDAAMCDHYPPGCNVLSPDGTVERFRKSLNAHQKFWVIPPAADPWAMAPSACYRLYSSQQPVDAVVPFMGKARMENGVSVRGADTNGMWVPYCEWGLEVLHRTGSCS